MIDLAPEYLLLGGAGLVTLVAFAALILRPALGSFARPWEKAAAGVLSLFILVTLVTVGFAVGALVVRYYNEIEGVFGRIG